MNVASSQVYTIPGVDSMADAIENPLHLSPLEDKAILVVFDGGRLSSYGGVWLGYADKVRNRFISGVRVRIEHIIGSVKRYRIVKKQSRTWKPGFRDLVFETCCGLHNFRLNFRPWHYKPITYLNCLLKS